MLIRFITSFLRFLLPFSFASLVLLTAWAVVVEGDVAVDAVVDEGAVRCRNCSSRRQ